MPARNPKSDYAILAILAIAAFAVLLLLIAHGWIRQEEERESWLRTTRSASRHGTMACHELYKRLGYSVRRLEKPLLDEALADVDVLLLIDPTATIAANEIAALEQWMRRGGVLIGAGGTWRFPWELHRLGPQERFAQGSNPLPGARRRGEPVPRAKGGLPLARDVSRVLFETEQEITEGPEPGVEDVGPMEVLFADREGVRIAARRFGNGRAILLADSSFLANGWIGKEDNAVLAANLMAYALAQAKGNRASVDEYHYGFGPREGGWSLLASVLVRTSAGWAVLALTAAGVMFLVYKGRRFGTRRSPGRQRRRSKVEYVQSVGATYRSAGARRLTLGLVYEWFRKRAAQHAGLPPAAPTAAITRHLSRGSETTAERYHRIFEACEADLKGARVSERRLIVLLSQLARIEQEALNGHRNRK